MNCLQQKIPVPAPAPGRTPTLAIALAVAASIVLTVCTSAPAGAAPVLDYDVLNVFPHDPEAYTQGLIVQGDILYESTGLYGESSMRKVDLETGNVLFQYDMDPELFGEGMVELGGVFYQITWQNEVGFVYSEEDSFVVQEQFEYPYEGWGLTHDGTLLIATDGSATVRYFIPETRELVSEFVVRDGVQEIRYLNELEFIDGRIWSNIIGSDYIAIIEPFSGQVEAWMDLSALRDSIPSGGVLNGIAFEPDERRLFVTGKNWPKLFEITVPSLDTSGADPELLLPSGVLRRLPNPVRRSFVLSWASLGWRGAGSWGDSASSGPPSSVSLGSDLSRDIVASGSTLRLYDISGRRIWRSALAEGPDARFAFRDLTPSVYFLFLRTPDHVETRKIVVVE